jgi:hypothetical protein
MRDASVTGDARRCHTELGVLGGCWPGVTAIGRCRPGIAGIVVVMPDPVLLPFTAPTGGASLDG